MSIHATILSEQFLLYCFDVLADSFASKAIFYTDMTHFIFRLSSEMFAGGRAYNAWFQQLPVLVAECLLGPVQLNDYKPQELEP